MDILVILVDLGVFWRFQCYFGGCRGILIIFNISRLFLSF